jgi:hypothetical protein
VAADCETEEGGVEVEGGSKELVVFLEHSHNRRGRVEMEEEMGTRRRRRRTRSAAHTDSDRQQDRRGEGARGGVRAGVLIRRPGLLAGVME